MCTVWGNAALCLCGGRRAASYFFESSILLASVDAARAFALLAEEVDLEQFFAVCPAPPQNMHKLLSKRHCLSCWVSLPSFPNFLVRGLAGGLDLSFFVAIVTVAGARTFQLIFVGVVRVVGIVRIVRPFVGLVSGVGIGILV